MKQPILLSLALVLIVPVVSAADAERCHQLLAQHYEPESRTDYLRSAESGYRECRGEKFVMSIRIEAYSRYADAKLLQGESQSGIAIYREALGILDASKSVDTALTIDVLDRLARAENSVGLSSDAIAHAKRALDLRKARYGANSTEAALGLSRLGMAYVDQKDYANAERFLRDAIRIATKSCGPTCDALSEAYSAMSVWYGDQGNEVEAAHYAEMSTEAIPVPPRRLSTQKE